jgi:hypothetical protein
MRFLFNDNDVSTVDDRAVAIFSSDASVTMIAKRDALSHDGNGVLFSNGEETLHACYSFAQEWIPFEDIGLQFDIRVFQPGTMDLITLNHGGSIRISSTLIRVHLITENGEMIAEMDGDWDLLKSNTIRISRAIDEIMVAIGSDTMYIDIEENCRKGLKMVGLFGEIVNTGFEVSSVLVETCAP